MVLLQKKKYLIVYHVGFQMTSSLLNLNNSRSYKKSNKIITHWDSFWPVMHFSKIHSVAIQITLILIVETMLCDFVNINSTGKHFHFSLLQQGYSLHQIQSKTGPGKSTIGRIRKEVDRDKENGKGGYLTKLKWVASTVLSSLLLLCCCQENILMVRWDQNQQDWVRWDNLYLEEERGATFWQN